VFAVQKPQVVAGYITERRDYSLCQLHVNCCPRADRTVKLVLPYQQTHTFSCQ
jgi:hypothetical protein